jgi:hypothetical protein
MINFFIAAVVVTYIWWRSVPFTHPSTFEMIAMEDGLKKKM